MKMRHVFKLAALTITMVVSLSLPSQALTLKSGQVLGSDGNVYDGASPEQADQLVKNAQKEDFFGNKKSSGVVGSNLFVVVEGDAVFIPLAELRGRDKDGVTEVVKDYITSHLISHMTAQHIAEEGGIDAEALADFEKLGIENGEYTAEIAEQITEFAQYDVQRATELLEATLDLATVDAANDAAREAAESALEQAFEAAHSVAAEAYDAIHGEGAHCEQDPNCEIWTPDSD